MTDTANGPAQKLKATDPEYKVKALEEGVARARNNIRIFEGETERQKRLKKDGIKLLKALKKRLKDLKGDRKKEEKRKIERLKDNIGRHEKNVDLYEAEAEKQRKLRSNLEIELQALKMELEDKKDDQPSRKD